MYVSKTIGYSKDYADNFQRVSLLTLLGEPRLRL